MSGRQQELFSPSIPAEAVIPAESIEQLHDLIMAQYAMNQYERRIFLKVIEALPEALDEIDGTAVFPALEIDAKDIIVGSELKGNSAYQELQKATLSLIRHVCRIAEADGLLQVGLLSSARYVKGKGIIQVRFDPLLYPYLQHLRREFLLFRLEKLVSFKSYYSQCLYELFKKVSKPMGLYSITLEQLRTVLRLEPTEYERYFDFKRFVLQQAQKELAPHDVSFFFREIKERQKVVGLVFQFPKLA
ncbi:MAG: replication initiation protein [Siphonobacter aquaeclarae]|jgi:plasmid replication initiation protein|nr:replication initiation protein [Siphonobacter aquaeclarae]